MTCGDGSFGALGHGDWNSSARWQWKDFDQIFIHSFISIVTNARPMLIGQLLSVDVVGVGAGAEHVVVVGVVYVVIGHHRMYF